MCDHCGACREPEWKTCPFCRAQLDATSSAPTTTGAGFDALAAAAEVTNDDLLPSHPVAETAPTDSIAPITAQDLAHLTGDAAPTIHGWDPSPTVPAVTTTDEDGVPKIVLVPLIAAAVLAVVFVAFSIVLQSSDRPEAVALVDRTTSTAAPTTTSEPGPSLDGALPIGIEIAEQATHLCRGDQFSIARAVDPSGAVFNDLMVAVRDGRDDWVADPARETLRETVPSLVGCLTTADGGEIDRCPNAAVVISRRSVTWSYRILRSSDGTELGADSGRADERRDCEELAVQAGGDNLASWSPLPQERLDAVASTFTDAPHPREACSSVDQTSTEDTEPTPSTPPDPQTPAIGLALDATWLIDTRIELGLPKGWLATEDRPVEAVLCAQVIDPDVSDEGETVPDKPWTPPTGDQPGRGCNTTVSLTAMTRSGEWIGQWDYDSAVCVEDSKVDVPLDWLAQTVGPELGHPDPDDNLSDSEPPSPEGSEGE